MRRMLARVFGGWRTGLSGPVIVLQAGTAVNYFGTGLVLPFEIIYLHQARGFPTATAGLVLAVVMATAAVVTPFSGALLDRFRAKPRSAPIEGSATIVIVPSRSTMRSAA